MDNENLEIMIEIIIVVLLSITTIASVYLVVKTESANKKENEKMESEVPMPSNDDLLKRIIELEKKLDLLTQTLIDISKNQVQVLNKLERHVTPVTENYKVPGPAAVPPTNRPKTPEPPKKTESVVKYYATASIVVGQIAFNVVDNKYSNEAPFVIEALGNTGEYTVNVDATSKLLNYIDTTLLPYTECALKTTGVAKSIVTTNNGSVQQQGGKWIVTNKAKIEIH